MADVHVVSEADVGTEAEAEAEAALSAFRQRWRQEVSARNRRPDEAQDGATESDQKGSTSTSIARITSLPGAAGPPTARRKDATDYADEVEPRAYHDLPDKDEHLQPGIAGQQHDRDVVKEPSSALEHYEYAVERETTGQLGDSLKHYRMAFRLDEGVQEAYKSKHFPPSSFIKSNISPNNTHNDSISALPPTLNQLISSFSTLNITSAPPPTDTSPQEPCSLAALPEELLSQILRHVAILDVAAFARTAQVCKRLAYLVLTEERIWQRVALGAEFGFAAMHYDFVTDIEGFPLAANDQIARYLGSYTTDSDDSDSAVEATPSNAQERSLALTAQTEQLLHTHYASSYRQLFRARPRLRFNGCYISTVNYTRPGGPSTNTLTWGTPVHVVTYFRYLRFLRDGTAISLLTTAEPADVVHHLTKANLHRHHHSNSALPSSVMRDALRGRWRLSGPASVSEPLEAEGDVHVETEGVVSKYTYRLQLALTHAGKGVRNNKLAWKGFWSYNRLTDDWGEFGLKNDRAFYWSRVRSYGMGW